MNILWVFLGIFALCCCCGGLWLWFSGSLSSTKPHKIPTFGKISDRKLRQAKAEYDDKQRREKTW